MAQNILQDPLTHFDITPNDLIQYKGLIYVTGKQNRDQILHDYHDSPVGGHQGIDRTYDRISENYYWPSMKKQVDEYIRNCDLCWKSPRALWPPITNRNTGICYGYAYCTFDV